MWIPQFVQNILQWVERLDMHQLGLFVVLIVVFGFYCLRGFGSRSNY
jgi:hypothetical protein